MRKKNLKYLVALLCMGIFVAGCGTKDEKEQTTGRMEKEVVSEKPKQTIAPLNVKANTLVFSCKTNEKNTPGYQQVEDMSCATFYVYGDMVFLVDSVNKRILLYENGTFKKEFPIGIGCDVVQMYYDNENNILKTINQDLDERSYVIYKACEMDLETGEVKEKDSCPVGVIFSEDGKLTKTEINPEEAEKVALKTVQKLKKGDEDSASIISKSSDGTEYCCSLSSWIYSPNVTVQNPL